MLKRIGTTYALVVPCKESKRLIELGLLHGQEGGSFARITPAGLRALADAADAGKIKIPFDLPPKANQEPGHEI